MRGRGGGRSVGDFEITPTGSKSIHASMYLIRPCMIFGTNKVLKKPLAIRAYDKLHVPAAEYAFTSKMTFS